MKKILLVVPLPPPFAGVEYISKLVARSNELKTHHLFVLRSNIRDTNTDKGTFDLQGLWRTAVVCVKLVKTLIFFKPHLVYMTISQNNSGLLRDTLYIRIVSLFRIPIIGHLHGSNLAGYLKGLPSMVRWYFLVSLSRLRFLIVLGSSIRDELLPYIDGKRMRIVYNGVEPSPLPVRRGSSAPRRFVVAFMGHLSDAKGFYDTLEAARQLLSAYPDIDFKFAGERLRRENNIPLAGRPNNSWISVDQLVSDYGSRVKIVGLLDGNEKKEFFASSDVFVLPSFAEAMPVVVLEAMEAGLPLVVSRVGALPEILCSDHAIFIDPGNINQLVGGIRRLYGDSLLRESMSRANQIKVREFSDQIMNTKINQIFLEEI